MKASVILRLLTVCSVAALMAGGCDGRTEDKPPADVRRQQSKLLALAYDTATAIPLKPHKKDRARTQQAVVTACIEADQPARGAEYARSIGNWRKGVALGDLAFHMARHGERQLAESYLDSAARTAMLYRGWRRDRIKVRIARVKALLGRAKEAEELSRNVTESETGKIAGVTAAGEDGEAFEEKMKAFDALVDKGHYDLTRNAVGSMVELLEKEYANPARRKRLIKAALAACKGIPPIIRADILLNMAKMAVEKEDRSTGQDLVQRASKLLESVRWSPRHEIPIRARTAKMRYLVGDEEAARRQLDAALEFYRTNEEKIVNIYRAQSLHPVAEAYLAMGDRAKALSVYGLAVEAGVANPNSRPRAIDLAATCCSMAVHGAVPDARLWARMREIRNGLSDPW